MVTSGQMSRQYEEIDMPAMRCIHGPEPFGFPRNANIGIMAAGRADVFLVNDDVTFLRANSVADLARIAHEHPEVGVLSPRFEGRVGNRTQESASLRQLTYTEQRLCFTGVYIRRAVIDSVGLLDEQFDGYGAEDDDFCIRVRQAGLRLAVTPEVVMRHGFGEYQHSASFRRVKTWPANGLDPEMVRRFTAKHGVKP
jgi:GT2 family glycosyltransferase